MGSPQLGNNALSSQEKNIGLDHLSSITTQTDADEKQNSLPNKKKKKGKKDKYADPNAHILNLSYEGRTNEEIDILKKQIIIPDNSVSYFTLYRYATKFDLFMIILANFGAICSGAALPLFTLIMGNITDNFSRFLTTGQGADEFQHSVNHNTLYFLYLMIGICTVTTLETYVAVDRGEVITARIREHYIQAILRQNIAYFDKVGPGEITNRITSDVNLIQEGISEKVNIIFSGFATFFAALVIGFIRSWRLTLILFSTIVTIIITMGIASRFMMKYTISALGAFSKASSVAEDILSSIRTTTAFGIQRRLSQKYDFHVDESFRYGVKAGRTIMLMVAGLWLIIYWTYGLAFWQGARFIADGTGSVGSTVTVIMSIIIGSVSIGGVTPAFQSVGKSVGAAKKIFETIDRVPLIDSSSEEGKKLNEITGEIKFQNVRFAYPSRPNVTVLNNFSLDIKPGTKVALVGASGSGKSTIIGILERFYSYLGGSVTLDGIELSSFNVKWLRQQMALVSQEPTLFNVSIFENISYGLIGTQYENSSKEEKLNLIIEACKKANAWEFIQTLPEALDTNVGQQGFLLSGGQKQRIAIARAIVSEPKILLLDEATSALDTKSEGVVQEALDRAATNRTTIVIAHRLSTIKDADKIVVVSSGNIIEMGTHHELLAEKGAYYTLVKAQDIKKRDQHEPVHSSRFSIGNNETQSLLSDASTGMSAELSQSGTNSSNYSISDKAIADMKEDGYFDKPVQTRSTIALVKYVSSLKLIVYFTNFVIAQQIHRRL